MHNEFTQVEHARLNLKDYPHIVQKWERGSSIQRMLAKGLKQSDLEKLSFD